jgi:membrane-associated phospholipid phosphatase
MRGRDHLVVADDTTEPARRGRAARLPAAPLLPAAARRPAAILAFCCLVLVIGLGALLAHQSRPDALDRVVRGWILSLHIPLTDMADVSRIGGTTVTTALTAALALGCLAARRVSGAMLAVAGVAVASALTEWVVKPVVDRTITIHHYVSYPSGHTTGLFALSAALAVVLLSARPARPWQAFRVAVVTGAVVVSAAVGVAMIGLDFHYCTDTVAGAAVGTGVVLGVAFVLDCDVVRRWVGRRGR